MSKTATAEATAEVATEVAAPARLVAPSRFFGADFKRNLHLYNLPSDANYADLFKPEAWRLIAQKGSVGIGDKIEVRRDDLSLYAELLVVESITNHGRIRVVELVKKEFAPIAQDESEDKQFEIKHLGLQDGWAVLNKTTGRIIQKDLKSKDAARSYINTDLRPQLIGRL
jgi:hypothetical protein